MTIRESAAPTAARGTGRRLVRSLMVMLSALALALGLAPAAQAQAQAWETRLGDFRFNISVDNANSELVPGGHVRFAITATNAYAGSIPVVDNRVITTFGLSAPSGFGFVSGGGEHFDDVGNHGRGANFWGGTVPTLERTVFPRGTRSGWLTFDIPEDAVAGTPYYFGVQANLETFGEWYNADNVVAFQIPAVQSDTTVTVNQAVSRVNEQVTLTANVAALHGTNTPTGTVTFAVDGQSQTVPVNDGIAAWSTSFSTIGEKPVTATFNPAPASEWQTSTGTGTVNVQTEVTTTDLDLSATQIMDGDTVRATAVITPSTAVGKVVFTVDGQSQEIPVSGGRAHADFPLTVAGNKTIRAEFLPTNPARYTTSHDEAQVAVSEHSTTTTVTVTPQSSPAGTMVEIKATLDPAEAEGTVLFEVANRTLSSPVQNGSARVLIDSLPAGTHEITASYTSSQPTRWLNSQGTATVTVTPQGTTTTVSVDPATVEAGGESVLTARVTPGDLAGHVVFVVEGREYLADVVDGVATTRVLFPNAGAHEVTATFKPADAERYGESTGRATVTVTGQGGTGGTGSLGSLGGDSLANLTGSLGS